MSKEDLESTRNFSINSEQDSPLFIIVSGEKISWGNTSFDVEGISKENIFMIFPDAQDIWLTSVALHSHLIAPNSRVVFSSAVINGNLVSKKFVGQGQVNISSYPDICPEVPTCEDTNSCEPVTPTSCEEDDDDCDNPTQSKY